MTVLIREETTSGKRRQCNSETLSAWAAGFFEGEGCVNIMKSNNRHLSWNPTYNLRIVVNNTVVKPLEVLHRSWGGKIYSRRSKQENDKTCYAWCIYNRKAVVFLGDIYPYLTFRQNQVTVGMSLLDVRRKQGGLWVGNPISPAEIERRELIYLGMKELNHRGR